MSCKKMIFLQLTLLLLITFLPACQKENVLITPPDITEEETNPTKPTNDSNIDFTTDEVQTPYLNLSNAHYALESEKIIRTLILNTLIELFKNPELNDFQSTSTADTRSACPDATVDDVINTNPDTLILDYGAAGCTTTSGADYTGIVNVILDGALHSSGTTVTIELSNDFEISTLGDIDGSITLDYDQLNSLHVYDITNLSLTNTSPSNQVTTLSHFPGMSGTVSVEDVGNDDSNPIGLLNDIFFYSGCVHVTCPNSEELQVCTSSDVEYTIGCGVPYEGEAKINEEVAGVFTEVGVIDFAHPNAQGSGVCDNDVEVTYDGQTSVIEL